MSNLIVGGGCFWCTEAIFQRLRGVEKVVSGYAGGDQEDPSYWDVARGRTNHAEAVQITFDSNKISYQELLEVFFATHDPTSLNRQGFDRGKQYRSAIFVRSEEEREQAEAYINQLDASGQYSKPIVTTVEDAHHFYTAEEYHQNFYNTNRMQPYCLLVVDPKLNKLREQFKDKLKPEYQ